MNGRMRVPVPAPTPTPMIHGGCTSQPFPGGAVTFQRARWDVTMRAAEMTLTRPRPRAPPCISPHLHLAGGRLVARDDLVGVRGRHGANNLPGRAWLTRFRESSTARSGCAIFYIVTPFLSGHTAVREDQEFRRILVFPPATEPENGRARPANPCLPFSYYPAPGPPGSPRPLTRPPRTPFVAHRRLSNGDGHVVALPERRR